jgi:hypothetical protein
VRADPALRADERATLVGFLRGQRETLGRVCAGLDVTALARRAVEPSALSLLGLVRHLADVEPWSTRRGTSAPRGTTRGADRCPCAGSCCT